LEALYVHDFDPTAFRIHPKVAAFYQTVRYAPSVIVKTPSVVKVNEETPDAEAPKEETTRDVMAEVSRRVRGVKVTKEPGE
jgi:hypothetical protein